MKSKMVIAGLVLFVMTLCVAGVVGIDGKWAGKYEAQYDVVLDVAVNGKTLTGSLQVADNNPISENPGEAELSPFIAAQMGVNTILDGKITGQDFTFYTDFNGTKIPYAGKIEGEKIILSATFKGQEVKTTLRKSN